MKSLMFSSHFGPPVWNLRVAPANIHARLLCRGPATSRLVSKKTAQFSCKPSFHSLDRVHFRIECKEEAFLAERGDHFYKVLDEIKTVLDFERQQLQPQNVDEQAAELLEDAVAAFGEGNNNGIAEALGLLTVGITMEPEGMMHQFYAQRAVILATINKFDQALADATEAVRLAPHWSKGFVFKGDIELQMGLVDRARASFEKARDLDLSDPVPPARLSQLQDSGPGSDSDSGSAPVIEVTPVSVGDAAEAKPKGKRGRPRKAPKAE